MGSSSLRALSRLSCLSFATATLRQMWPHLPSSAPWMNARTSSVREADVVVSPWIPTLAVWRRRIRCDVEPFLPVEEHPI